MREPCEAPSALLESAGVVLESAGRSLGITVLNKALFLLDVQSLLNTGSTATGATRYVALKAGPVVESYSDRLVGELERLAIAMQDDDDPTFKPVTLLRPVKPKFLVEEKLELARRVGKWVRGKTATELSTYLHQNPGWIEAWRGGDGQGDEINLRIAMQQLLDDDPWLKEPLNDEERTAFAEPDGQNLVDW